MRPVHRRIFVAWLAIFLCAGSFPAAAQDTSAVAINTKDGTSLFKFAFGVKRAADSVVDNGNAAVAFASCTDCQTVAVSIQIVLITGDPAVASPENLALAINEECSLCDTMASAYQFVFSTGGPVHFSPEGNQALAEIKQAFRDLIKTEGLSLDEINAQIEDLVSQVANVLGEELVAGGPPEDSASASPTPEVNGGTPTPADTPAETTSTTTAPTTSTTEATTTTSTTVDASPTPEASPSATP